VGATGGEPSRYFVAVCYHVVNRVLQVGKCCIEHTRRLLAGLPVLRLGASWEVGDVVGGIQFGVDFKILFVELLIEAPDNGYIFF